MKKIYLLVVFSFFTTLPSQQKRFTNDDNFRKNYEHYLENDSRAFHYINLYIQHAKTDKNSAQLAQAYEDAAFYSESGTDKLKYADSTITAALSSRNNDLISNSYLKKGIVYDFNFKKYKPALDQYIKAYEYSKDSNDGYLKNEILYRIGIVKNYMGYYDSALDHFQKAHDFSYKNMQKKAPPNVIFNNKKAYYNTLHSIIICHRNLNNFKSIDSLINTGVSQTQNNPDFQQEYGYFLKERGIEDLHQKEFTKALINLHKSLQPISQINDFAGKAVTYFYLGKAYLALNNFKKAIPYFEKVDDIFQKHAVVFPELLENYELLINHYKKEKDDRAELYYTKQLLKADDTFSKDFAYLSSTIHKKYDIKTLQEEKKRLEIRVSWGFWIIITLSTLAIVLMTIIFVKERMEKRDRINYRLLEEKILTKEYTSSHQIDMTVKDDDKCAMTEEMTANILEKLKSFEEKCGFIEQGLTINKLAHKFHTNSNYLSHVINEHKGVKFNRYLGVLRINYITEKLYNDKLFLSYKIETLAEKCGIASRTNFSNLFQESNGIRPTEFIKKIQQDRANGVRKSVMKKTD